MGSQLPSDKNNPCAKVAYFGVAYTNPFIVVLFDAQIISSLARRSHLKLVPISSETTE